MQTHDHRALPLPRLAVVASFVWPIAFSGSRSTAPLKPAQAPKINGLVMSIEFEGIDGVRQNPGVTETMGLCQ